jgi:formimidoylglutamate deiminase
MLENIELSDRFHFVHATHLTNTEIKGLAEKNVNVVLCPTTEGNLGDGIFPLREFQASGGDWSIGTDSHVSLNPFEELRLLDYGQRLVSHKRNTFTDQENGSSGSYAIAKTTLAGRKAMNNFHKGYFSVGQPLDACVISAKHPLIDSTSPDNYLNTFIYSADETMQKGTIVRGKWKSENGQCPNQEKISEDFVKVMKEINNR